MEQNQITLTVTESERQLIEAERKRKEAEAAEMAARKKVSDAKKIEAIAVQARTFTEQKGREKIAYRQMFDNLNYEAPNCYSLKVEPKTRKFTAENYRCQEDGGPEILASQDVAYESFNIVHIAHPEFEIVVEFHDGEWRYRIHCGLGYPTSEKFYKKASTVAEKIHDHFEQKRRISDLQKRTLSLQDQLVEVLKAKYPDAAKIEKGSHWESGYSYRRGRRFPDGGHDVQVVIVTFPNSFKVIYTPGTDSNGQLKANFRSMNLEAIDVNAMIDFCKTAPKKA